MNKLVRDGKVAVLIAPSFGAGWYTWNYETPEILFDPGIVSLLEERKWDEMKTYVALKYPQIYKGAIDDLQVEWVPEGALFKVNEYDGSESLELKESDDWIVA